MIPHFCFLGDEFKELRALLQSDDRFWELKANRKHFVSASDVPNICGFGWITPRQLWKQKCGLSSPKMDDYTSALMKHGRDWEPYARREFEKLMQCPVIETGMWVHPIDQRLSASPDGLMLSCDGFLPLEIKCPNNNTQITEKRRHKDSLQLQTQIQCVGAPYGFLFYFYPDAPEKWEISCYLENWEQWMDIVAHADWMMACVKARQFPKRGGIDYPYNIVYYQFLQDEYFQFLKWQAADNHRAGIAPEPGAPTAARVKFAVASPTDKKRKAGGVGEEACEDREAVSATPKRAQPSASAAADTQAAAGGAGGPQEAACAAAVPP